MAAFATLRTFKSLGHMGDEFIPIFAGLKMAFNGTQKK